jgi:hypothetical protein
MLAVDAEVDLGTRLLRARLNVSLPGLMREVRPGRGSTVGTPTAL